MQETVDHIKNELLPDYDFDAHNHDDYEEGEYKPREQSEYKPREQNYHTEKKEPVEKTEEDIEKSFDVEASTPITETIINKTNTDDDVEKWD